MCPKQTLILCLECSRQAEIVASRPDAHPYLWCVSQHCVNYTRYEGSITKSSSSRPWKRESHVCDWWWWPTGRSQNGWSDHQTLACKIVEAGLYSCIQLPCPRKRVITAYVLEGEQSSTMPLLPPVSHMAQHMAWHVASMTFFDLLFVTLAARHTLPPQSLAL